jgi:hypothetical protein
LKTISAEYRAVFTSTDKREPRRINKIDNPISIDTVEVIGSIPVAPTSLLLSIHLARKFRHQEVYFLSSSDTLPPEKCKSGKCLTSARID